MIISTVIIRGDRDLDKDGRSFIEVSIGYYKDFIDVIIANCDDVIMYKFVQIKIELLSKSLFPTLLKFNKVIRFPLPTESQRVLL